VALATSLRFLGLFTCAVAALGSSMAACSSADDAGDPDVDPIAWVSPNDNAQIEVGETIELTVKVNDDRATAVRFAVDGRLLSTCDGAVVANDCRRGPLFRFTTKFAEVGRHRLVASFTADGEERSASVGIDVRAKGSSEAGAPETPTNRGFLDPDMPPHQVFGGVSWSVEGQRVVVDAPPTLAVAAIAACMKTYGASIIKHSDAANMSRASVIATAITETSCTNPSGSSDGLSAGPMQVTGSTCASVAGGGISAAACTAKMFSSPDFSFEIGAKYLGSSYQLKQHGHDPPKVGAAYNAGSIRQSTANRWHMVVTGTHLERFVAAYNAYRAWEQAPAATKAALAAATDQRARPFFEGEHVTRSSELPRAPREGQVYFVGDWASRDGAFVTFRDGQWVNDFAGEVAR
jgi:hypothetical protein